MEQHTNYWGEVSKPLNPRIRQGLRLIERAIQEFLNYWGANRPFTADDVNKYLGIHIEYNTFSTDPYSYVEPRIDLEQFLDRFHCLDRSETCQATYYNWVDDDEEI